MREGGLPRHFRYVLLAADRAEVSVFWRPEAGPCYSSLFKVQGLFCQRVRCISPLRMGTASGLSVRPFASLPCCHGESKGTCVDSPRITVRYGTVYSLARCHS